MEKKTIGSFLAVLRKSQGMTQQEVADRLNVSNKTISKWEREESYPEITLIPVIAELFQVTSDEILRGERITKEEAKADKSDIKTEKQIRRILDSNLTKFRNVSMIAFALLFIGLIFLFTISYAFYKSIVGFGVFLLFVILSILLEGIQLNLTNAATLNKEILTVNGDILSPIQQLQYKYAFQVFVANAEAIIFALPFLLWHAPNYLNSVISFRSYVALIPALFVFGVIVYLISKKIYEAVTKRNDLGNNYSNSNDSNINIGNNLLQNKKLNQLNIFQGCLAMGIYIDVLIAKVGISSGGFYLIFLLFPALVSVISVLAMVLLCKGYKLKILLFLAGVRNIVYSVMGIYLVFGICYWLVGNAFMPFPPTFYGLLLLSIGITVIYTILQKVLYNMK